MFRELVLAVSALMNANSADAGSPVTLGSGHRGLLFSQVKSQDPLVSNHVFVLACNKNPGYASEDYFAYGDQNIDIILQETFSTEYINTIGSQFFAGWNTSRLFSFGPNAAFFSKTLFKVEQGHIRIFPGQALLEARRIYHLSDAEIFLGSFDGRVYFWVEGNPQEVRFRAGTRQYRLKLQDRVMEPLGMAKGSPRGDVALFAVAKPPGFFHMTPRVLEWEILNFKDASLVE